MVPAVRLRAVSSAAWRERNMRLSSLGVGTWAGASGTIAEWEGPGAAFGAAGVAGVPESRPISSSLPDIVPPSLEPRQDVGPKPGADLREEDVEQEPGRADDDRAEPSDLEDLHVLFRRRAPGHPEDAAVLSVTERAESTVELLLGAAGAVKECHMLPSARRRSRVRACAAVRRPLRALHRKSGGY